jgi:3-hydroxybutyryl-CoA dehydrogenase
MEIKKVAVLGAGTMGLGIAQVAVGGGFETCLYNRGDKAEKGALKIKANLDKLVQKQLMTEGEAKEAVSRLKTTNSPDALADFDIIIESVAETFALKEKFISQLNEICKPEAIFASNTSSYSITEMASFSNRPEQFIGVHFFNPAPAMKLVEIVRGYHTSDETVNASVRFVQKMGKETIVVNDGPLFVVNRILVPMLNEAMFALEEGVASKEDIDKGMMLGTNHPMGPLALADLVGLDTLLHASNTLYNETKNPKYTPAPAMVRLVRAGCLGRKTGKGFYDYSK